MTPGERYRFDLQGYVVRRGVLSPGEVEALNVAVDLLHTPEPGDDIMSQRFVGHLTTARRFRDLLDHDGVLDIVVELCGPNVRLDHAYGIIMRPGTAGLGLHGGGHPFDPAQYYTVDSGNLRSGLVAVQWALVDHVAGRGGFLCVPGSHKANFPLPNPYDPALAVEVPLRAGDVVVFTEALTHGTAAWQGPQQRRTLLYKYSPGNSAWSHAGVAGGVRRGLHTTAAAAAAATLGRQPPTGAMINRLFVYGTLRPGEVRWKFLEPFVDGEGYDDSVAGALYDTGHGYPAARFDQLGAIFGRCYELRVATLDQALVELDAVESAVQDLYRRVIVCTAGGVEAWAYEWCDAGKLTAIEHGDWPAYVSRDSASRRWK